MADTQHMPPPDVYTHTLHIHLYKELAMTILSSKTRITWHIAANSPAVLCRHTTCLPSLLKQQACNILAGLSEETEAAWATERPCLKKAKPQDKRDTERRMQPSDQLVPPMHKTLALR